MLNFYFFVFPWEKKIQGSGQDEGWNRREIGYIYVPDGVVHIIDSNIILVRVEADLGGVELCANNRDSDSDSGKGAELIDSPGIGSLWSSG